MPGPPRKPTYLKVIEGNRGRRPLPTAEPRPAPGIPTVPDHLSPEAKAEWRRVAKGLNAIGLLTKIDRATLAGYCQAWSDWVEAEEQLRRYGKVVKSPVRTVVKKQRKDGAEQIETTGGFPMQSPFLAIRNKALDTMHKFAVEFGMTPAARSRIGADIGPRLPKDDKASRYF
jgi:P27 family predicted phage terminase small subunit